jgi:hypothetical protein
MRTRTDVAKVVTSESTHRVVAGFSPNLIANRSTSDIMTADSVGRALSVAHRADALVHEPGLASPHPDAIQKMVRGVGVPLVPEAAAFKPALEADFDTAIFTPDSAGVERIECEYESLEEYPRRRGVVVVSKGAEDVIIDGEDRWTNEVGTPGPPSPKRATWSPASGRCPDRDSTRSRRPSRPLERRPRWRSGRRRAGHRMLTSDVIDQIPTAIESGRSPGRRPAPWAPTGPSFLHSATTSTSFVGTSVLQSSHVIFMNDNVEEGHR